jgi:N-acetyl-anhydromuramyl-L-alanine amidase AmpD
MNKSMTKAKDTRTEEQKGSLISLIADLRKKYPSVEIHGHNEYAAKACPSFDVSKRVINARGRAIRLAARKYLL